MIGQAKTMSRFNGNRLPRRHLRKRLARLDMEAIRHPWQCPWHGSGDLTQTVAKKWPIPDFIYFNYEVHWLDIGNKMPIQGGGKYHGRHNRDVGSGPDVRRDTLVATDLLRHLHGDDRKSAIRLDPLCQSDQQG